MTNATPCFLLSKILLPNGLHFLILIGAILLLPGTMLGAGVHCLSECETPFDEVTSSEDVIILNQRRAQLRRTLQVTLFLVPENQAAQLAAIGKPAQVSSSAHRLPNNLLAPLRL